MAGQHAEAVVVYERYLADPSRERARDGEVRTAMEASRELLGGKTYSADDIAKSKELMTRGVEAVRAGRYDEALLAFREAHAHNPLPEFLNNQAFCLEKLGAPLSAALFYREFAAATPNKADASQAQASAAHLSAQGANAPITASGLAGGMEWMQRGNQLLAAHKYNEALAAFQEGFRTYPDSKFILNEAAALNGAGRYAEADLAYQRYLSDPKAERADEAREAQQRLRTDHLGGREATITGVAESERLMEEFGTLYKAGKYGEAFDALERARVLNPLPILRHDQAVCLVQMGKPELAAQFYERYLQEAPRRAQCRHHPAQDQQPAWRGDEARHGGVRARPDGVQRGPHQGVGERVPRGLCRTSRCRCSCTTPRRRTTRAATTRRPSSTTSATSTPSPNASDADRVRKTIDKLHQPEGSALIKPATR